MSQRSARTDNNAPLKHRAEFFGLRLQASELRLQILALQFERLLRVLSPHEVVGEFKGVHILLGIGQHVGADRFHGEVRIRAVTGRRWPRAGLRPESLRTPCAPARRFFRRNRATRSEPQMMSLSLSSPSSGPSQIVYSSAFVAMQHRILRRIKDLNLAENTRRRGMARFSQQR